MPVSKTLRDDQSNLITSIDSQQAKKRTKQHLKYSPYGELTQVINHTQDTQGTKEQSHRYQYDLNGNRLSLTSPTIKAIYTYASGTDRLLSIKEEPINSDPLSTDYRYDNAGNPVLISTQDQNQRTVQQRQFSYGVRGELKQIKEGSQSTDYRYNHAMQRVSKTTGINTENKQEQRYLWQQGLLDAEIDVNAGQEILIRRYIYMGLRPVAVIDYDKDNNPSIYTIHTDHLGTPQQVTNEQQEIVWQGEYDAFGNVTVKATPQNKTQDTQAKGWSLNIMNKANAAESTRNKLFEFNLRFAGQYEDSESGYYYNWHRYYNPETGRYLTSDPIGLNGGLNTYGYAGQNPVQAVDPWGLFAIATWDDTVDSNGRTKVYIDIPILFQGRDLAMNSINTYFGSEVDPKKRIPEMDKWVDTIQKVYSGNFGNFEIVTRVTLLNNCEDANDPVKLPVLMRIKKNNSVAKDQQGNLISYNIGGVNLRKEKNIAIDRNDSFDITKYETKEVYNTFDVEFGSDCTERYNADIKEQEDAGVEIIQENVRCTNHVQSSEWANTGHLFVNAGGDTVSHEVGHMLGIGFDPYIGETRIPWNDLENDRWHNVMSNSTKYPNANWVMFSIIFDSSALIWKDGKMPEFDPYDERIDLDEYHRWRNDGNRINNSNEDKITKEMISENARKRIEKLKELRKNN